MINPRIKRKFVFIGDTNSINIEIVIKSFTYLKNKISYIIICNTFVKTTAMGFLEEISKRRTFGIISHTD